MWLIALFGMATKYAELAELIFGVSKEGAGPGGESGQWSYLVSSNELAVLDRLDLALDRVIHLDRIARRWPERAEATTEAASERPIGRPRGGNAG